MDVHTDSLVLKSALESNGCRNSGVNNIVKDISDCCRELNFSIDVHYVPSSKNLADFPFRKISDMDCMSSERAWGQVERPFGPHTFDLMSLDSNCQHDGTGQCLPHFTPYATLCSSGVNVFVQSLPPTTICMYSSVCSNCAPSEMNSRARFSWCIYYHYHRLEA